MMIDYLVAGLGNPGEKYANSRHNIGWMVANSINLENKIKWKNHKNILLYSELNLSGKRIVNMLPLTYMNNSGEAVKILADKYKISPENIIIIVDEYNFPVGKVHVKQCGSDGGHNGVASVIDLLGSADFIKMRCGIGKDFPSGYMVDYVLSDFPTEQHNEVIEMINKAIDSVEHILSSGFSKAMSDINSGRLWSDTSHQDGGEDVRNDN